MFDGRWIDDSTYEIPADSRADMRVPARVFADEELLGAILQDSSLEQLRNVATLPGIVDAALAMPDIHQGYGFPVGGLAATEVPDGVVSPGGVGYDINCGVRLLALPLTDEELGRRREPLVHQLSRDIPAGAGKGGGVRVDLDRVLVADRASEEELVAIDDALQELARRNGPCAELVKLRFFAGLSVEEAARCLGISRATADRYWAYARAWLHTALKRDADDGSPE